MSRISSNLTYHPEWDIPPLPDRSLQEVKKILDQPYSYLGKGAQSFVFASQDGQYVLKFIRHHHMQAPWWIRTLPWQRAQARRTKKEAKLHRDFNSYLIAYQDLKEEAGLVFLHLNKTDTLHQSLTLIDKLEIRHLLNLDDYEFILQKRASLVYPSLGKLIEQGRIENGKQALTSLVQLLVHRSKKGISDKDPDLNTNFGFIGLQPIQIDIGRFKRTSSKIDKDEIVRITDNLHQWLMVRSPELDNHLKDEIEKIL